MVGEGPLKTPLDPVVGAANVTVTPLNGLLPLSFTNACSSVAKGRFTVVLCELPALTATLAGTGTVFVRLKLAGVPTPATLAVTV